MSEEENERDFITTCFNVVAGLEVKNESQAIAKEVILDEVEYLTKENKQLKEVIEEVRGYITTKPLYEEEYDYDYEENSYLSGIDSETAVKDLLQILDKGSDK